MSENMVPIEGEKKKRVVSVPAVFSYVFLSTHFFSVISLTRTLVVFIMAPGIRKNLASGPRGSPTQFGEFRMKPTRIRMCHSLVMNYGLYKKMEIFVCYIYYSFIPHIRHLAYFYVLSARNPLLNVK